MTMTVAAVGVHVLDTHVLGIESIPAGSEGQLVETIRMSPAGTAGGTAVVFFRFSENAYGRYKAAPPEGKQRYRDMTRDWDWATTTALGVVGAAGAAGVGLLVWESLSSPVRVTPGAASVTVSGSF